MNTKITIVIDLSEQTFSHVSKVENLAEILNRVAEKELYRLVSEDFVVKE